MKPFIIPRIKHIILKLYSFINASFLDLNMGYYNIELLPVTKNICTVVLPWVKYKYQKLPMGVCNSPGIFGGNTSDIFDGTFTPICCNSYH